MTSHLKGPSDGEWSVFAEKVVKERDEARAEVAALRESIEKSVQVANARIAAAVAVAREEQREACARAAADADCDCPEFEDSCRTKGREALHDGAAASVIADMIRATPLNATPLADRIRGLEAYAKLADVDSDAEEKRADEAEKRAEKAEAKLDRVVRLINATLGSELEEVRIQRLVADADARIAVLEVSLNQLVKEREKARDQALLEAAKSKIERENQRARGVLAKPPEEK